MISLLIAILLTLSTGGDLCQMGQTLPRGSTGTDGWTVWLDAHPDAQSVVRYDATEPNFRVYQDGESIILFVFRIPVADTIAAGESGAHGQCARDMSAEVQSDG